MKTMIGLDTPYTEWDKDDLLDELEARGLNTTITLPNKKFPYNQVNKYGKLTDRTKLIAALEESDK